MQQISPTSIKAAQELLLVHIPLAEAPEQPTEEGKWDCSIWQAELLAQTQHP